MLLFSLLADSDLLNIYIIGPIPWHKLSENQYKTRGFRHVLSSKKNGGGFQSVLQEPSGAGDGTVSISSGGALDSGASKPPEPEVFNIKHEPAYKKNDDTFRFVRQTIAGLCQIKLEEYGL